MSSREKTNVLRRQFSVALLIETSSTYGRQILRGIHRFVQTETEQEWTAVLEERDLNYGIPKWLRDWSGDGVISRQPTGELQSELRDKGIAFVELNDRSDAEAVTSVRSDDEAIGRLGAEHLAERGLKHFAFCGFKDESWSELRETGFRRFIESLNDATCESLQADWFARDVELWDQERVRLTNWLEGLPKPVGIMAGNDLRGKQLIDCCHQINLQVPEAVSIVGVDNDELVCNFSRTPMSSVIPNAEGIGFRAAKILAGMLEDESARKRADEIRLAPLGVFARRSSDIVAIDDRELAAALRYIRHHACEGISVADVVNTTGMSRSTLGTQNAKRDQSFTAAGDSSSADETGLHLAGWYRPLDRVDCVAVRV